MTTSPGDGSGALPPTRSTRIPVGGGSPEGENSAYLLAGRGLLVDPGPAWGDAWTALREGIEAAGADLTDLEAVFVTHWHVDHAGLAVRLSEAADATILMHEDDAPLVGDYVRERERRVERDARRLREWGVPEDVVEEIRSADPPSPFPDEYPVEPLADGDTVAGLDVLHTPGHTLGHAALADAERGDLLVGDAVLPTYTPNVGGGDTRLSDPLGRYLDTLERIHGLGWTEADARSVTLHPGHGSGVDFPDRLDAIRRHHDERTERVLAVLREVGRATPWTVAEALFGEMDGFHAKMGAGEAAAHLVRLAEEGSVELVGEDPDRYEVVGGRAT